VISMLHYYLTHHVPAGSRIILYSDNCCAQNKNQTMIGYLSYLVKVLKLFEEIEMNFLIAGHTKFSPDQHFGRIKNCIQSSNCYSIQNLMGFEGRIQQSAINNFEILYKDPVSKEINFTWNNWKDFIKNRFLPCQGITH